jgi:hypothetical protein
VGIFSQIEEFDLVASTLDSVKKETLKATDRNIRVKINYTVGIFFPFKRIRGIVVHEVFSWTFVFSMRVS